MVLIGIGVNRFDCFGRAGPPDRLTPYPGPAPFLERSRTIARTRLSYVRIKLYGVVEFDSGGRACAIVEKPPVPRSNWAVTGLYFYDAKAPDFASKLKRSARGELEITDLNKCYLSRGELFEKMGRGYAWLDTGTPDSLIEPAESIRTIQLPKMLAL
jgi:glucose-1-phosphate thymidylyltransferase